MKTTVFSRMSHIVLSGAVLLVLLCPQAGFDYCSAMEPEIQGLILNRAQTRFGHEFHRQFVSLWSPVTKESGYTIQISEKASARWGSIIQVLIDGKVVCQANFGARSQEMKKVVKQCVVRSQTYLYRFSQWQQMLENDDVSNDGF